MPEEKPKMVTANIRYARTVIMETTVEVPETDFDDNGEYVGSPLDDGRLPGVYSQDTGGPLNERENSASPSVPAHVEDIVDDDTIWEVTKGPRII